LKKIVTVIGARPQFIKAAVLSRLIRGDYSDRFQEILIHTGQHYDKNMSDVFFNEMDIPEPDINLEIGSGSHGKMTGRMLEKIEKVLLVEKPDLLMVYGDTNSTIAGALAASKLHIPVAHVEAGLRSFNKEMPEEQNRILTDHISDFLFCPTDTALDNLKKEGITEGVFLTGDIMLDASIYYRNIDYKTTMVLPRSFTLVTLHRAENTDSIERLSAIVEAFNEIPETVVLPLHPRTKKMLARYNLSFKKNVHIFEPVGYLDMLQMENQCRYIITDSGGVQKEAYFFRKPCITMRNQTEWVETVEAGWNTLVGADKERIINGIKKLQTPSVYPSLYGTGISGKEILNILNRELS